MMLTAQLLAIGKAGIAVAVTSISKRRNLMKRLFVLLSITILAGIITCVQAQERPLVYATVPFSFTVENTRLPAGSYTVYLMNPDSLVRIQSADGRNAAIIRALPSRGSSDARHAELVFQRIDNQYFLSQVREQASNLRRDVALGSRAHELAKNRNAQQGTLVAITAR
jgi:hypothetical protein